MEHFNRNSNIFIYANEFESVVCEMQAILSRPQCVNVTYLPWVVQFTVWCRIYVATINNFECIVCTSVLPCLITGGILFVLALYMTEDGQYEGATKGGKNMLQTMQTIWKQLHQEGKITNVSSPCVLFESITLNSLRPSDTYMRQQTNHKWFR